MTEGVLGSFGPSFEHADNKRVSVAIWMMEATRDTDGSANWNVAALLAQVTWWCQPDEHTGKPRAKHLHPGVDGYWLVRSDDEWAEELGISARTVQRFRKRLVELGLVECRRFREQVGTAMHWRRIFPAVPDQMSGSTDALLADLASSGPDTEPSRYKEDKNTTPRSSENPLGGLPAVVRVEAGSDDDPAFGAFWSAYPSKKDKGGARKAWRAAIKKASPETIVAGVERFAGDPNLPDPAYIPHPKTWLNGERWNDGPLPSRIRGQRVSGAEALLNEMRLGE